MANHDVVNLLKTEPQAIRAWRVENADVRLDLREADLTGIDLRSVDLSGADLTKATLRLADLRFADLSGAILRQADLYWANLIHAHLSGADLRGANLAVANLGGAKLIEANLSATNLQRVNLGSADLSGANVSRALFGGNNLGGTVLSNVNGLDTIQHLSPSSLGIDTLFKAKGSLPDAFLRGCGVPDVLIARLPSLALARDYYSCFISYSHRDERFAERLFSPLQAHHLRVWYAPHAIRAGRKYMKR